jgi:hypothetical protein
MPDEQTLQAIRDLFDGAKTDDTVGEKVWGDLFGDCDQDGLIMFLGVVREHLNEVAADGLYWLMAAAYRRTERYEQNLEAYINRLIDPPRKKGGRKR